MTHFVGFGQNCTVAEIMNRGNLRHASLPFDFIFAFPSDIKKSLDNDFNDWLDPQYLEVIPRVGEEHFATKHSLYDEHTKIMNEHHNYTKTHAFFNHHNLLDEKDRDIFVRRIARYREIINSNDQVVLITNSSPESIEQAGLSNYYINRSAPTDIVFLKHIGKNGNSAKISKIKNGYLISYVCPEDFNDDISMKICNLIKRRFQ